MEKIKPYILPAVLALAFLVYIVIDKTTARNPKEKTPPDPVVIEGQNISVIEPCKLYRLKTKDHSWIYWSICTDTLTTGVVHSTSITR